MISISGKLCSGGILEISPIPLDQIKVFVALVLTQYESRMQIFRGRFSARFIKDFYFENNWLKQSDKNLVNRTKGTAKLLSKLKFIISSQRLFTQLFSNILYFFTESKSTNRSRDKIQNNTQTILQGISNYLKTQWQHNRTGSFLLAMWLQVAWWCSSQGILKRTVSGDGI